MDEPTVGERHFAAALRVAGILRVAAWAVVGIGAAGTLGGALVTRDPLGAVFAAPLLVASVLGAAMLLFFSYALEIGVTIYEELHLLRTGRTQIDARPDGSLSSKTTSGHRL